MNSGLNGLPSHFSKPNNLISASLVVGAEGSLDLSGGLSQSYGSAVLANGAWVVSGGNGTTTKPYVLIEPAGTPAHTNWNTNGTGLGINAPGSFTGNIVCLSRSNSNKFTVDTNGSTAVTGNIQSTFGATGAFQAASTSGGFTINGDVGLSRTAAKIIRVGDGGGNSNGWMQWGGQARVSSQFDKTADTTLANITGLSVTVASGRTYTFRAYLHLSPDAVGGQKYAMAGTCTATSIIYQINTVNNTTNASIINSRQTALGGSAGVAGGTADYTEIVGTITVNAGGTLTVQFAQNAASGTSSVLVGSFMEVNDAP